MIRLIGYFFGIGAFLVLGVRRGRAIYLGDVTKDLPDYEVLGEVCAAGHDAHPCRRWRADGRICPRAPALSADPGSPGPGQGSIHFGRRQELLSASGRRHRRSRARHHVNVQNCGSGRRPVGASTITQQVAKNFLLSATTRRSTARSRKRSCPSASSRPIRKDRILELYLNEIFFGLNSYGIAGAALTYFDKSVKELTVAEAAYLAALPKGRPTTIRSASRTRRRAP